RSDRTAARNPRAGACGLGGSSTTRHSTCRAGRLSRVRFSILVHGHQPPDNYNWVFHEAIEEAYAPFFSLLDEFRWLRVSVHFSGSLLEWIERNNPALIDWMRTLVERGQVELVTAGLSAPVLALIPPHDRANQILA